ncbi:MAG: sigma-70 family RNA polymerase sigma factor [Planctomycetota bacterium]
MAGRDWSDWANAFALAYREQFGHDLPRHAQAELAKWLASLPARFDEEALSDSLIWLREESCHQQGPDKFIPYLKKRIWWRWQDQVREERSRPESLDRTSTLSSLPSRQHDSYEIDDYTEALLRLCRILTPSEIIVLRSYLDGMSVAQVGALHGFTIATVSSYLSRVRRKARKLFSLGGGPPPK